MSVVGTSKLLEFPVLAVTRDGTAVVYEDENNLTTGIARKGTKGYSLQGYQGMRILDGDGYSCEVARAVVERDLGPLYGGFSLSRLVFGTRRIVAEITLSNGRLLTTEEALDFVNSSLSALFDHDQKRVIEVRRQISNISDIRVAMDILRKYLTEFQS
jgi:hypothetical protein